MSDVSDEFEFDSESDGDELVDAVDSLIVADFSLTTLADLRDSLLALARRAADMTGTSAGTGMLLLNAYDWDLTAMASAYVEDPGAATRALGLASKDELGLLDPVEAVAAKPRKGVPGFTCPICMDVSTSRFALGCRHFVCRSCFAQHVHINTIQARRLFSSSCPGSHECALVISRDVVARLVSAAELDHFDLLAAQFYVDKLAKFRHCPRPGCEYIAQRNAVQRDPGAGCEPVECACANVFCFTCGLPTDHAAVPCEIAAQWLALVDHEHRSTLWISQNTKQCPQCRTKIQRSEGCNHMSCGNCKYEFCWVCSLSWAEHSGKSYYNCVKFVPTVGTTASANGAGLATKKQRERLDFYMARYDNHASLAEYVDEPAAKAHNLLAWSFVLLYCSVHTNNKILLEELVTDLGRDLEDLSPRLRSRTEALQTFVLTTKWTMNPNVILSI